MNCFRVKFFALIMVGCHLLPSTALAEQILINPGQNWVNEVQKAKPGDEIVLMPGQHRSGNISDYGGTIDQPIIIRGLDPDHQAIIKGDRFGLILTRPGHLVFKNIIIDGAEVNGILIDGSDRSPRGENNTKSGGSPDNSMREGSVKLINVTIINVGTKAKKRNAIELYHTKHVDVVDCNFERWSGVGVEIIGCDDITFDHCRFKGTLKLKPVAGVRARAGSTNISIANCTFDQSGLAGVCAGGISQLKDFPNAQLENVKLTNIFEVRHVSIERNVFIGGSSSITLSHCDRVQITRNTIVDPKFYVFCLLQISQDDFLGTTRRCTMVRNLITWTPDSMVQYFLIDKGVEVKTLKLESNLWWSSESVEARQRLGSIPQSDHAKQHFEIDPKLDDRYAPTSLRANGYGALAVQVVRQGDTNVTDGR